SDRRAGLVAPALLKLQQSAERQVRRPGVLPTEGIEALGRLQRGFRLLVLSKAEMRQAQGVDSWARLRGQTTYGLLPAQPEAIGRGVAAALFDHWPDGVVDQLRVLVVLLGQLHGDLAELVAERLVGAEAGHDVVAQQQLGEPLVHELACLGPVP